MTAPRVMARRRRQAAEAIQEARAMLPHGWEASLSPFQAMIVSLIHRDSASYVLAFGRRRAQRLLEEKLAREEAARRRGAMTPGYALTPGEARLYAMRLEAPVRAGSRRARDRRPRPRQARARRLGSSSSARAPDDDGSGTLPPRSSWALARGGLNITGGGNVVAAS